MLHRDVCDTLMTLPLPKYICGKILEIILHYTTVQNEDNDDINTKNCVLSFPYPATSLPTAANSET